MNDTSIARGVRSVASDYDTACKRLLSEKQVLSRILHEWLHEFAKTNPCDIEHKCLEGEPRIGVDRVDRDEAAAARICALQNEDSTQTEGCTTFDIRFEARLPGVSMEGEDEVMRIELNIEAQNDFRPGYPLLKRGIYYCGRLLSMQGGDIVTNSHYERVRKVVSIWVCAHPPKRYSGTVTVFSMNPEQYVGKAVFAKTDYDLVEVVMACLDYRKPGTSPGALGMLEVLLTDKIDPQQKLDLLHDSYGIIVTDNLRERVSSMCNLSEGVLNRGIKKGREEGRKETRAEFLKPTADLVREGVYSLREAASRFGFTEQELAAVL